MVSTKLRVRRVVRAFVIGWAGLIAALAPSAARGAVTQPDGVLVVPIDGALSSDLQCCNNTLTNMSLDALFKARGEMIDYRNDATTEPAAFSPLCGLNGSMVLHGGGCKVDFGWYCTSDADPPTVHPLVTAQDVVAFHDGPDTPQEWKNSDKAFVPKVGQQVKGAALANIRDLPAFKSCASQKIGFAVRPSPMYPGEVCTMPKYSEQSRNQKCSLPACSGRSWINAVVYASTVTQGAYYLAFEDLPTAPDNFRAPVPGKGWTADGDFNDFVYIVQGITCEGGSQPCTVTGADGKPLAGVCQVGITSCSAVPGQPGVCKPKVPPSPEKCDNVDNDCNGIVDDGDMLCPPAQVCFRGRCIAACGRGEFVCTGGLLCETQGPSAGYCVEPQCVGKICGPEQVCRTGTCVGACDGVTCPEGQQCVFGECFDACKNVTCPEGFACTKGVCAASCKCMPCATGQSCGDNGVCFDSRCTGVNCPANQICKGGTCIDPCINVTCPGGGRCVVQNGAAACTPGSGGGAGGSGPNDGGGGVIITGVGGGIGPVGGAGGAGGSAGDGAGADAPDKRRAAQESGCGCRIGTSTQPSATQAALLGLGLAAVRGRRKTRRPAGSST
jgi:hypothetical protein